jgi:hypothetical protein
MEIIDSVQTRDCSEGILELMRSHLRGVLVAVVLASTSGVALAQGGNEEEPEEDTAPELIRECEPFLKRDGQVADNEQLGGEPSLTEAERPSGDAIAQTGAKEGCYLDCIEAGPAENNASSVGGAPRCARPCPSRRSGS